MDQLGVGGRVGMFNPDSGTGIDDGMEYALVVNYFLNGHYLKLQNQVSLKETAYEGSSDDLLDVRYDMQLSGYF
jgi:hypothetical protein